MAVAEGLEPSISGLTIRRLTNLATPQRRIWPTDDTDEYGSSYPCYLCHLWLKLIWKPAEELNLVPSAQLLWFGLEDRCQERGPLLEAMVRFELTRFCLQDSRSTNWSYIALLDWGTGREADAPLRTPRSRDSLRSARMSHAPIACE